MGGNGGRGARRASSNAQCCPAGCVALVPLGYAARNSPLGLLAVTGLPQPEDGHLAADHRRYHGGRGRLRPREPAAAPGCRQVCDAGPGPVRGGACSSGTPRTCGQAGTSAWGDAKPRARVCGHAAVHHCLDDLRGAEVFGCEDRAEDGAGGWSSVSSRRAFGRPAPRGSTPPGWREPPRPGLRWEEVAVLAGISVGYCLRLERDRVSLGFRR
jgi:hypothetical protein